MIGNSHDALAHFCQQLQSMWQISDAGDTHFCVGIMISCDYAACTVSLSQTTLIDCVIAQFGLSESHHVIT